MHVHDWGAGCSGLRVFRGTQWLTVYLGGGSRSSMKAGAWSSRGGRHRDGDSSGCGVWDGLGIGGLHTCGASVGCCCFAHCMRMV